VRPSPHFLADFFQWILLRIADLTQRRNGAKTQGMKKLLRLGAFAPLRWILLRI
jgi:hypothetical protein